MSGSTQCTQTASLFDHLVGPLLENPRHVEAEGICGFEVDDEQKLGRPLHWKLARLASKDAAGG